MSEYNEFVSVPVLGSCITRNGSADVGFMNAVDFGCGNIKIGFVSSKLHRSLNAGVCLRAEDLDKFCEAWVKTRTERLCTHLPRSLNVQSMDNDIRDGIVTAVNQIRSNLNTILKSIGETEG